mgnify:CR=1 FL=1
MRVGTSKLLKPFAYTAEDHPHACGDKKLDTPLMLKKAGSSPCVWGQVFTGNTWTASTRIIPMRVGTRSVAHIRHTEQEDHPHACGDKTKEIKENSGFAKSTA